MTCKRLVSAAIVFAATLIAWFRPPFQSVLSIIGAFGGGALAFIGPAWAYMNLYRVELPRFRRLLTVPGCCLILATVRLLLVCSSRRNNDANTSTHTHTRARTHNGATMPQSQALSAEVHEICRLANLCCPARSRCTYCACLVGRFRSRRFSPSPTPSLSSCEYLRMRATTSTATACHPTPSASDALHCGGNGPAGTNIF